jgi:hypothetical protein
VTRAAAERSPPWWFRINYPHVVDVFVEGPNPLTHFEECASLPLIAQPGSTR